MTEESNFTGDEQINKEVAVPIPADQGKTQETALKEETQDQNVPLSALQAEREKRQQAEEKLRMMEDHLALNQAQQSKPKEEKKDIYDGLEEGDVLTVGEHRKITSGLINQFQMTIEEMRMTQKHPDYQEVITTYLPEVLKQNPSLHKTLQNSNDYELAYFLAKNSDSYRKNNRRKKESDDAKRIVANSKVPGNLSSMGSTASVSQAKRYKDMSDKDFEELVNRNSM